MAEALSSQHTQTFPSFLAQAEVSLLVSTYQAGKLIILRHQDGVLNTHFVDMHKPMGMALREPQLAVGSAFQVSNYYNMPGAAAKVEPVDTHDACYLPRNLHITGDIDIHEMAFADDGELWLVNTRMSCLCTLSTEHSVVPQWRPPFVSAYDLFDRCHLNGLAMRDGQPAYVSALGATDTPGGWRDNKAAGGLLMDVASKEMIATGLSMPHSPRWYQNQLWVLESGAGSLATVDLESGKLTTIIELPGFTRGLEFVGRYAIIGLSQVRETAVFAGLPLTERCKERQCGVWIIDIVERQVVGYVVFAGEVQEIFSVQILPSKSPAILSIDDPLLRSSYSLPDTALQAFSEPNPEDIRLDQATALHRQGELKQAIIAYQAYLIDHPKHPIASYRLGVAYSDDEQWQSAIALLEQVVEHDQRHAEAYNALGHAWAGFLDWEQALNCYAQAIAADQQYATAHFNRGLILLRQADYKEGWDEYEWRWKMPDFTPFTCPQSQWGGEDISDKALLVHTEQGNGDAIQFARFLPLLAKRCRRLVVVCSESLRLFFKAITGVDEVRLPGQIPADVFQVFIPIMSVPGVLQINANNLPATTPYWSVPKEVVVPRLAGVKPRKVGLVWKGSATQKINHHRSCSINHLLSLTDTAGIDFYSLQLPVTQEEVRLLEKHQVSNLEQEMVSYVHTGALIEQMDLVISVCTSVAHLSASLGKPTWVLLSVYSDWRWLMQGGYSPWYPEVRLFRQTMSGDWDGVISHLRAALLKNE